MKDYWNNEIEIKDSPCATFTGIVSKGKQLGRTIDFPTVNLFPEEGTEYPEFGVYFSEIEISGDKYYGITNVGVRPTVSNNNRVSVETYIFGFDKDVYGKTITVKCLVHTRPELKFDSVESLKGQLDTDKELGLNIYHNFFGK